MSKMGGKDLYVEFDPLEGLVLRTLNDAKSAFCSFTYQPSFFERCSAPPLLQQQRRQRKNKNNKNTNNKRKSSSSRTRSTVSSTADDEDDEDDEDEVYKCRIPLKAMAAVTKSRKGVSSLRIRNETSTNPQHQMFLLTFEFHMEHKGNRLRVVHRLGVEDADGVRAVADDENASEIVALPKFLLRMMEPLKKSEEVAFIVNDKAKLVTMASFHHHQYVGEASAATTDGAGNNAVLQSKSATLLKTETSVGADEFDEFHFVEDRKVKNATSSAKNDSALPSNVNEEVTLVCSLREPKALLQFFDTGTDDDVRVSLHFHWGGKPLILQTKTPTFCGELVMATLDYKLLRRGGGDGDHNQQRGHQGHQQ
eukprot:CAMPEP_0119009090 /NCGR_PEP_ID=MMETSP1176-20130426/4139_1 /TAXON_ID=265551 /ORGANISM="Synedropsis recta cf, Strain CCMP1620" /LENGTH=365 /DNA_ID=CAMNT_0006961539 /DNA_START=111 /DNA_END=1211 /DNA_ORIENTATION=+